MAPALSQVTSLTVCTMNLCYSENHNSACAPMRTEKKCIELDLYLVLNPHQCIHQSPVETAAAAAAGGVNAVQIRSKDMSDRDLVDLTRQTAQALAPYEVSLLINDHVELTMFTQVDGVHLGQDDLPVLQARKMLGEDYLIGLTVRSKEEAERADLNVIDYLSIGGIYSTRSKWNPASPIGVDSLQEILNLVRQRNPDLPVVAISGINETNVVTVLKTGVDGVAVVSSICESKSPKNAALRLKNLINSAKNQHLKL